MTTTYHKLEEVIVNLDSTMGSGYKSNLKMNNREGSENVYANMPEYHR